MIYDIDTLVLGSRTAAEYDISGLCFTLFSPTEKDIESIRQLEEKQEEDLLGITEFIGSKIDEANNDGQRIFSLKYPTVRELYNRYKIQNNLG